MQDLTTHAPTPTPTPHYCRDCSIYLPGLLSVIPILKGLEGPQSRYPVPYTFPDLEEEKTETPEVKHSPLHCSPDVDPSLKSDQ